MKEFDIYSRDLLSCHGWNQSWGEYVFVHGANCDHANDQCVFGRIEILKTKGVFKPVRTEEANA